METIGRWVLFNAVDRQEAKMKCAFRSEVDSGHMRSVPKEVAQNIDYIKEVEEDEDHRHSS